MKLTATYTLDGQEPATITSRPVDIVQWEVSSKRKLGDGKGIGFEDMTRIIYLAAKRTGAVPADMPYQQYLDGLESFDAEAETTPTSPAADPSPEP